MLLKTSQSHDRASRTLVLRIMSELCQDLRMKHYVLEYIFH